MSDSTQQYILKQSIEVEVLAESYGYERDLYRVPDFKGYRGVTGSRDFAVFEKEDFEELFKPLDIPAIEKQLWHILNNLEDGIVFPTLAIQPDEQRQDQIETNKAFAFEEIMALAFGLENKEDKS